jgi:hypothetical protein
MGERLFRATDVFALRAGRVVIATDCLLRLAAELRVSQPLEFRNPDGSVVRSAIAGIEMADPPNPDRTFAFPLPAGMPAEAVQIGAEVWSLGQDQQA